jgi:type II secretory pathway component PulF
MKDNVQRGQPLSDTLDKYPRVFSPLQTSLVRVGESGGMLDEMMDRIASYIEHELKIRRMVAMATFYPVLVLCFALFMMVALPHIQELVSGSAATFFALIGPAILRVLAVAVIVIVSLKLLFQFQTVRLVWDSVKVLPPLVGTACRKTAMSRFSRALALLYSAGLGMPEALSAAADASANLYIASGVKKAIPAIQRGEGLTASLGATRALTPMVMDMLTTGEKTGSTDAVLEKVADYMDEEVQITIQKLGVVLFVGMIVAAGVVVAVIAASFYGGYFNSLLNSQGQ